MMQKKIFTLALAAGLAAPLAAFADNANVNFYGVLDADFESVTAGTAPAIVAPVVTAGPTSRGRVTSNASRFGLKGSDDLGDGLQGIFQIESRVNLAGNETTKPTGGVDTNFGIFDGIRNSNLGLQGNFGTAFVGQWDTPFKVSHNKVELFDNSSIATSTALLGSIQGSNKFNVRQGSSIQYWTPSMNGFQVKAAYSTVNAATDTATASGTPSLLSASGAYDAGPIYVALAYEQHKNVAKNDASNTDSTDSATRLVGAYTVDAFQVGLTYESITIGSTALVPTGDQKRTAYSLSGKYKLPVGTIAASYTNAGDYGSLADSGATQISLRYGYTFSKRTELYGMYTQINNKAKGTYNFADVTPFPAAAGAKVGGFGVGVRYTF